jgi:ABC-type glycerol-3-phosphate transport system substrate-binding protein
MKILAAALLTASTLSLAACGGKGDDKLGDQAATAAENRADTLEAQGENMEDQAEAIRDNADDTEEAIDDADVNAAALTPEQRAAITNGSATVR